MAIYNIKLGQLCGETLFEKDIELSLKKYKTLPYGLGKYNNKMSSDIEKMLIKDLEETNNINLNENIKKDLNKLILLARKYPTYYWTIKEIDKKIEKNNLNLSKINNFELNHGGYNFVFNFYDKKYNISNYSQALELHLELLKNGDYKMAELLYQIANRMTDNPNNLYKDI